MGFLSDVKIKAALLRDQEYMLADGDGLYLRVRATGKSWVYRYKLEGKTTKLGLGPYPAISLAAARQKAQAQLQKRAEGIDPKEARRDEKEKRRVAKLNTFEAMAREPGMHRPGRIFSGRRAMPTKSCASWNYICFPGSALGRWTASGPPNLCAVCIGVKERGNLETAQRIRATARQVYQHAVDIGALDPARNFVNGRTGGLPTARTLIREQLRDRRAVPCVAAGRLLPFCRAPSRRR